MEGSDLEAPQLAIRLLGPFDVRLHGAPLPRLRSRKGPWLLALLALRHGRELERAWLAGTLWPDSSERDAFVNLRQSLTDLRRALGTEAGRLRSPTPHTLSLDLSGAAVDLPAFDAAIARGDTAALEEAISLYRGPLLEGCAEDWVLQEREVREQAYLTALERLGTHALAGGDAAAAADYLRRAVAADPLRESAQRVLMEALAAGGSYAAAIETYRNLRLRLHRELNAEPDPQTTTLYQQIRAEAQAGSSQLAARSSQQRRAAPLTPNGELSGREPRAASRVLPDGTVTFLFTDIEGSTKLWEEYPEAMQVALARHDALLRATLQSRGGHVFKSMGDQFCAAFATAPEALAAALTAQQALGSEPWGEVGPVRVRMALHTGAAEQRDGDYFGPPLNRVARLLEAAHGGQVLVSLATEELVREELLSGASLRDLGSHRLKDLRQPEHICQLVHPDLRADFPPLRSLEAFAHNLPAQLTNFIGREQQMAEVKQFLATTRLLTLTGSGGCGKTRLALQLAADVLEEYPEGVWLVELAALADPALVPQTVASALGVREEPGRPLTATLTEYLRGKQVLLVLDNCEHLLSACVQLADALLRGCPSLRMLASSREGLGIRGEQTYRVPSLTMPDARHLPPLETVHEFEAVQLFADRARLSQATFLITLANAPAVAQICERLDGIPLAIELAAARVRALPVEQIHERLDDMFRLLTGGSRTALPRQQTLRALIDWSFDLLSEGEQTLLRRLSVFAGGWTLGAAEAVCMGENVEAWEVLDLLTSLVDKSLVPYDEQGGEGRYRLLETVRQYARDRLLDSGEAAAVWARHCDWCLTLAEQAEEGLHTTSQKAWLDRLEREHDNLRAALGWCSSDGPEAGLRLGGALREFWWVRGYHMEGREHLAALLALPGAEAHTAARAKALHGAGRLAYSHADFETARAFFEESLAIQRGLGNKRGIAESLNLLGWAAHAQGDYGAARPPQEESLAISRELGHKHGIAWSLIHLGQGALEQGEYGAARTLLEEGLAISRELGHKEGVAGSLEPLGCVAHAQGEYEAARVLFEQSLAVSRELGGKDLIAWSLNGLGWVAHAEGEYRTAQALFEQSLAIFRELGSRGDIAWSLTSLGHVARLQGEYGKARALFEESLAIERELGEKRVIVGDLEGLAAVAVAQGEPERAARSFGAAEGLREAMGAPLPPADRAENDRSVAAVRTALGEEGFAASWAEGRALPLEQAICSALEESEIPPTDRKGS